MNSELIKAKPQKLKPKQRETIKYWITPTSETYGNLYKSAVKAGFRPSYALNLTHLRPSWLSDTIEAAQLEPEHIRQGIQYMATKENIQSRSPDDTRLDAYELLAKISGMIDNKNGVTVNVVQPILNGQSVKPKQVEVDVKPTSV